METNQNVSYALDRYIELRANSNFDAELIFTKLKELSDLRKENISVSELQQWTKEFKNLGFKTRSVLKKIQYLKYMKHTNRKLRFSHFIKDDEFSAINYELLKMEAECLLKDFLNDYWVAKEAKNFAELIYTSLRPEDENELVSDNTYSLNSVSNDQANYNQIGG